MVDMEVIKSRFTFRLRVFSIMEQTEKNVNQNLRKWSIEIIVFVVLFFKLLQGSHASRKNFEIQKTKVFFLIMQK